MTAATMIETPKPPRSRAAIALDAINKSAWEDERYKTADRRLNALRLERKQVDDEVNVQQGRLNENCVSRRRNEEAYALAHGLESPAPEAEVRGLQALYARAHLLDIAIDLAAKNLRKIESEVSREIVAKARPEYLEVVRRVHKAAVELAAANAAEDAFTRAMIEGGTLLIGMQRCPFRDVDNDTLERYETEVRNDYPELLS